MAANKLRVAWQANLSDHTIGLAWSPDGSRLAAATVSGPIFILDSAGKSGSQLKGHGFGTAAVAWQPNGELLASAGQDGKVRLWKTTTGVELATMDAGAAWVERVAWHPSGTRLASAAGKKTRLWDASGQRLQELPDQAGTVTDLAWRPGTNQLAVLGYGAANVYDTTTGKPVHTFGWKGSPLALAWSPDGKVLAHGNQDATVHFWYAASGKDLQMSGFPSKVRELSWDSSGRFLATGGGPVPCLWDCAGPKGPEGSTPQMLEGHEDNLTALAYQARGYLLASAALDGRVLLWQPANKKEPKVGEFRFDGEATTLRWSPDDKSLAAGSDRGGVVLLKIA
ncbi:MAG: WD40 repeat domain-containing protein [Gemmataceae bacterium]